jgi:tRNA(fMet)-specific endonuclease VapC
MKKLSWDEVCVSAITKCELLYGVEVSPRREQQALGVAQYLRYMPVLDFPSEAGREYALIRAELKRSGKLIGGNDLLIAAHARHLGLILVTNNVREFNRVASLKIENWSEEKQQRQSPP